MHLDCWRQKWAKRPGPHSANQMALSCQSAPCRTKEVAEKFLDGAERCQPCECLLQAQHGKRHLSPFCWLAPWCAPGSQRSSTPTHSAQCPHSPAACPRFSEQTWTPTGPVMWAPGNAVLPYGPMSRHMEFLAGGRRGVHLSQL